MKHLFLLFSIAIIVFVCVPSIGYAQPEITKIDARVREALRSDNTVRVIVSLNEPINTRDKLTPSDRERQNARIRGAQDSLLREITGVPLKMARRIESIPAFVMEIGSAAVALLERSSRVARVYPTEKLFARLNQSVPYIGADQAWNSGLDGTDWYVAIVDSGIDTNHNDLKVSNNTIIGYEACFSVLSQCTGGTTGASGPGTGTDCTFAGASIACAHGTMMAGIVASRNNTYKGVAPGARLISIRVASGYNPCTAPVPGDTTCIYYDSADVISALGQVASLQSTNNIAAVNLSLGTDTYYTDQAACNTISGDFNAAVDLLRVNGTATVVASGNADNPQQLNGTAWPGCVSSVVSVGATNNSNQIRTSSVSAPYLSLLAPGQAITTLYPGNLTATGSGTSGAAAHVSGAWAILKQKKPEATVGQILNALQTTGVKITDTRSGANNRVNCRIQIDEAVNNIPDPIVTLPIPDAVAYGINNCGQIVGTEYVNWTGFLTDTTGTYTSIVYDGPIETGGWYALTEATAINNKGEVSGYYCCDYWGDGSYKWNPNGTDPQANYPNSYSTDVYGNNDFGDLVGDASTDDFWNGFKKISGNFSEVPNGDSTDINNMGRIVGVSLDYEGYLLDENGGLIATFNPSGSTWTVPWNINESGTIVGHYEDNGFVHHGFVRKPDGTLTIVDNIVPGATDTAL